MESFGRFAFRWRTAVLPLQALCLSGLVSSAIAAPRYLGPNNCTSCHDHEIQKKWADKDKHSKALLQLEDKKASEYAAAIGLPDPYSLKGSCVGCHATVFSGDANAGVSCETCHGAGSDYVKPHVVKGSYSKAVALGMIDTRGNYARWARLCVDCHIVTDRKLTAAGHSSGARFEVSGESQKIKHWMESYDFAKLAAAGRVESARRSGGAPPAAAAAPKVTPTPAPTKEPKATPTPAPTKEARATITPTAAREQRPTPAAAAPTRPEAAPSPTTRPAMRESPPEVSARATPTAIPPIQPTPAPPTPSAAPISSPTAPKAPATPSGIVIEIQATPIPTVLPKARERSTAAAPTAAAVVAPPAGKPRVSPTRRPVRKKPRPKPAVRARPPATVSTPSKPPFAARSEAAPTPTRTRVPAPLRTLRAPH